MADSDMSPYASSNGDEHKPKSMLSHMFNKHMIFHAGLMITGMVVPVVGLAAAKLSASATFGDIALGTADMIASMVQNTVQSLPVLGDAVSNALSGEFSARSYEWGMMDHGTHIVSADGSGHMLHGAADVDPNWTADEFSRLYGADDASSLQNLMDKHPT